MRRVSLALGVAVLVLVPATSRAQVVVETYSSWDGSSGWEPLGLFPHTDAYGQSFTAPAQYLNSWTYWMRGSDGDGTDLMFTANVATWTGNAIGSVIWTSGPFSGAASGEYQQYTFDTGGLSLLTGGQVYIFFLDAISGTGGLQLAGFAVDDYTGGSFNYHNGEDHFAPWDGLNQLDLAFRAEFDRVPGGGADSTVPEPATMTLLATGLAGMAAARRRQRKQ